MEEWRQNMEKSTNVLKNLLVEMLSPQYFIRFVFLYMLCKVHDITKYKVVRKFVDLFYWPDGFCLDTIVVIMYFVVYVQLIYLSLKICIKGIKEIYKDLVQTFIEIQNMDDDDESIDY